MLQGQFEGFIVAIGDNIKRLRRDRGWTQGELSEASGIKIGHVSKLERNESNPKLDTLQKLMNALDCSPNALLQDVENTSVDGLWMMAVERIQGLPDTDKTALLNIIDKYCIAVSLQDLMDTNSKSMFGFNISMGKTQELTD